MILFFRDEQNVWFGGGDTVVDILHVLDDRPVVVVAEAGADVVQFLLNILKTEFALVKRPLSQMFIYQVFTGIDVSLAPGSGQYLALSL